MGRLAGGNVFPAFGVVLARFSYTTNIMPNFQTKSLVYNFLVFRQSSISFINSFSITSSAKWLIGFHPLRMGGTFGNIMVIKRAPSISIRPNVPSSSLTRSLTLSNILKYFLYERNFPKKVTLSSANDIKH